MDQIMSMRVRSRRAPRGLKMAKPNGGRDHTTYFENTVVLFNDEEAVGHP